MLTDEAKTFLRRAVPHVLAGKSFEDALRAVLADDQRLFNAMRDTADRNAWPDRQPGPERVGDVITRELAARVYNTVRKEKA